MIQVKTTMKASGNGTAYTDFSVVWPPTFTGSVKFESQKNYTAGAKPGGRIGFHIS
jgi:hypothetical protein